MSRRDDSVPLGDMFDAAREVRTLIQGMSKETFLVNRPTQLGVAYLLQTIGEAAKRVTADLRNAHREIAWPQIMGMRNKIVHDYRHVDYDEVWRTASEDIPELIAALERFVPSDPSA